MTFEMRKRLRLAWVKHTIRLIGFWVQSRFFITCKISYLDNRVYRHEEIVYLFTYLLSRWKCYVSMIGYTVHMFSSRFLELRHTTDIWAYPLSKILPPPLSACGHHLLLAGKVSQSPSNAR